MIVSDIVVTVVTYYCKYCLRPMTTGALADAHEMLGPKHVVWALVSRKVQHHNLVISEYPAPHEQHYEPNER